MQITVEVSEEIRRDAELRGLPVVDFVEDLVARGMETLHSNTRVSSAIERIRALRSAPPNSRG